MPSASIHLFNPFNLQHGSDQEWHRKLQEVIYYGDSRFRQALADISKSDSRHHLWMQKCLQDELVCEFLLNSIKDCLIMSFQLFIMSYGGCCCGSRRVSALSGLHGVVLPAMGGQ